MALEKTLDIQAMLTQVIVEGGGTERLVCVLACTMTCCAVLENPRLENISTSQPDALTQTEKLQPYIDGKSSPAFMRALDRKRLIKEPVYLEDEFEGSTTYRIVAPVLASGASLGFLSLVRADVPFTPAEMAVLTHAAGLFALQLIQDRKIAEIELRLKGNFVEDLISAKYSDPDSILNRARALDYPISLPHRVLVGEIDNIKQLDAHLNHDHSALLQVKAELVQRIQSRLDLTFKGMAILKNDEIIMLVRQEKGDDPNGALQQLAEDIIEEASRVNKVRLYIGIGSSCSTLSDYQASYLAAKKALEIGAFMITEGQVRSFEQFKVHALFLSTLKPEALYNYARSQLGALLDYDDRHHAELLKTLQEFLYLRNNIEGTARSLNMSVSGLKYRLEKIEKIIGLELRDYKVSFDLQLALIILQLFGEYRIKK